MSLKRDRGTMRRIHMVLMSAVMAGVVGALVFVSCASQSRRPPQTTATVYYPADGGPPVAAPSGNKVIVPGDKATSGMITTPSGATSSTGTNGQAVGPTIGAPSGGN
jgi:hypothetical protein